MSSEEISRLPTHYVGIGASAGGLEAIEAFFNHMPVDSDAAFVVVQHLSPDYKSLMTELLSKRTEMPVRRAEEGMLVEKNHVYLIPPNHDLRIFHGKLHLTEQDRTVGLNLPVDTFLSSLAEDQGDKAVGIILSGTGSDGSRGIRAIKESVGMVTVQSEESAAFNGMPRAAIATGMVDYILPPEEMPEQLLSYIKHPYEKKVERSNTLLTDEDGLARIFLLLRDKTGIDFTYYKPSTVVRRIERRMTVNQIMDLRDYVRFIENSSSEIEVLHKDLLIGVTRFFRDQKPFTHLAEKWLPKLIKQKSEQNEALRLWTAGCSSGEETYTLAILCQEVMQKLQVLVDIKIFATDVDQEAINRAGLGVYTESIVADVPRDYLNKYFFRKEEGFQISRSIREMVVFAHHNVIKDPPFTNLDLISCRNLLIYLQPVLQKKVLELFNFSLNSNGIMMLGSSETTGEMSDYFTSLDRKWKIYRSDGRKSRTVLSEPTVTFDAKGRLVRNRKNRLLSTTNVSIQNEGLILERLLRGVSDSYLPFTMVINEELELLHVVGDAGNYLKVPTGKMMSSVNKLAHKDLTIPITTGVQKVIKELEEVIYTNIHLRTPGENNSVVALRLMPLPTKKGQDLLIAIMIEKSQLSTRSEESDNAHSYDVGVESEQHITDLENELQFTRESLQATVEELETSNEELQATNEELLASNEELQSTNEELQSVNEELYTVNAEYQDKITELTNVNNDLDNLLSNTQIATLFLGENLEIRRFTQEATHFLHILDHDIGRPFDHFSHDLFDVDLDNLIKQVQESDEGVEQEVQDKHGQCYLMRILPYRIGPEIYSGIVLTFVNIDKTKQMRTALEISEERYAMALKAGHIGSWEWDIHKGGVTFSDNIESLFGLKNGVLSGSIEEVKALVHPEDYETVRDAVRAVLEDQQKGYSLEHRILLPDQEVRYISGVGEVFYDQQDRPERVIGVVHDITNRTLAEQSLKRSEQLFRSTLEKLDMIAVQLDQQGKIIFVNDFFIDFSGWRRDELIGADWVERFIPEPQQGEVRDYFVNFVDGKESVIHHYENCIQCKHEEKRVWWNHTPLLDGDGKPVGVSSIGEDLSEVGASCPQSASCLGMMRGKGVKG